MTADTVTPIKTTTPAFQAAFDLCGAGSDGEYLRACAEMICLIDGYQMAEKERVAELILSPKVDIPMPGDRFGESTVIASTWLNDTGPKKTALLMLLGEAPPYYTVTEVEWASMGITGYWATLHGKSFPNINPATACYADSGGDW